MVPSLTCSVIVPVYNAETILRTTLPAITRLHGASEIVLVDDGSTDSSRVLLEEAAVGEGHVRVIHHPKNRGRAAARNTGVEATSGELVLFIDCDVLPEPDLLTRHSARYHAPEVVAVVSNNRPGGLDGSDPFHLYLLRRAGPRGFSGDDAIPLKYFTTTCTSVRRSVLEEAGPFDELITYGEDLELGYRMWRRHPRGFRFAEDAVASQLDVGDLSERCRRLREFGANLGRLFARHPSLAAAADLAFVASRPRRAAVAAAGRLGGAMLPHAPGALRPHLIRLALAAAVVEGYRAQPD